MIYAFKNSQLISGEGGGEGGGGQIERHFGPLGHVSRDRPRR